jgi:CBS domain-containing protein
MVMKIIPDIVSDQTVCEMRETGAAAEAARRMTDFDVGCVAVVDDTGRLTGVVTERDIARRIVAPGLDPEKTTVGQFMTRNPDTLSPDDSPLDALELMWIRKFRHLPVVDGDRLVGMVSIRDLYEVMKICLEQSLGETEASLFDDLSGT